MSPDKQQSDDLASVPERAGRSRIRLSGQDQGLASAAGPSGIMIKGNVPAQERATSGKVVPSAYIAGTKEGRRAVGTKTNRTVAAMPPGGKGRPRALNFGGDDASQSDEERRKVSEISSVVLSPQAKLDLMDMSKGSKYAVFRRAEELGRNFEVPGGAAGAATGDYQKAAGLMRTRNGRDKLEAQPSLQTHVSPIMIASRMQTPPGETNTLVPPQEDAPTAAHGG